jgi:hypothetical protein
MASDGSARRRVAFGGHQAAEYALAAALAVVGLHLSGRSELVLVVAGGVLAFSAIVSKGPLAAWRVVPRRLHLYLDLPIAACFALSPLLYLPGYPLIPIVISEAVAVVLVRMSLTTEFVPRPRPERGSRRSLGRLSAGAGPSGQSRTAAGPSQAPTAAATAGRLVGTAVAKARDSGAPSAAARGAARGLGRATGHARRLGRAAAAGKAAPPAARPAVVPPATVEPTE